MAQLVENAVDKSALVEVSGGARIPEASRVAGCEIAISKFRGGSICITPQNIIRSFRFNQTNITPQLRFRLRRLVLDMRSAATCGLLWLVFRLVALCVACFGSRALVATGREPRRAAVAAAGRRLDRAQRRQALVRAANRRDGRPVFGQVFGARGAQRRAVSAWHRPHHALPDKTHHAQGRFARQKA